MVVDTKMRILVVDDYANVRRVIKNILNHIGFESIAEADNGVNAMHILKIQDIDLVICDWNMPVMSGLELLQWVRRHDEFNELPFLMVTAEAHKENVLQALTAKASGYIIKPFTANILRQKIMDIFMDSQPIR
ncbi:MAG: response regulator [Desulfarculus sp.]|nr:response regulator [Desulfarculus sp.]